VRGISHSQILWYQSSHIAGELERSGIQKNTFRAFYLLLQNSCELCPKIQNMQNFNLRCSLLSGSTVQVSPQNYYVLGLRPSSNILKTREHNVLETGSMSVLR
jgi:hypothetical protein